MVNEGVITARLGRVGLAAGEHIVLDLSGDGFLSVAVPSEWAGEVTDIDGNSLSSLVSHAGTISAHGGLVRLSAATARDLVWRAVQITGDIIATSVREHEGMIILEGGAGGSVVADARLSVSAADGADGGSIAISGHGVSLGELLEADGAGGGRIEVDSASHLSLAETAPARGLAGDGGAVAYTAQRRITEIASSSTDVSGAHDGGTITLAAGRVFSSGRYRAVGAAGSGGRIDLTGQEVNLLTARLDASGAARGGLVRVGGAYQGGRKAAPDDALADGFVGRVAGVGGGRRGAG